MRVLFRILIGAAVCAGLVAVAPATASAVIAAHGYVWADRPGDASYTVTNDYRYNSTGGDIVVTRPSTGVYAVRFAGMGVPGGVAHVRPYGSANTAMCTIVNWLSTGGDEVVNVRCFSTAGTAVDTRFTANFTNRSPGAGDFGYLWANQTSPALGVPYNPSASYRYDSTGVVPQVWRQAVGVYMMIIGAVDAHYPTDHRDGVYQITAYNSAAVRCEVHGENDEDPTPIGVFCTDHNGALTDTRFSVTYAHGVDILGAGAGGLNAHFRYHSGDPTTWYLSGYQNAGGMPTTSRLAVGRYRVTFPGVAILGGHAVAMARGTASSACAVAWWSSSTVDVHCFDRVSDAADDSEFAVAFTV